MKLSSGLCLWAAHLQNLHLDVVTKNPAQNLSYKTKNGGDMNNFIFTGLCLETAHILNLSEPESFSNGEVVSLDDVDIQFIRDANNGNLTRLFLELGELNLVDKVEVYESLFSIQLLMEGVVDGQFVLDNLHDRMMFVVRLPLSEQTQAEQLASVIKSFVLQVLQWRATIFSGYLLEDEFDVGTENFPATSQEQPAQLVAGLA